LACWPSRVEQIHPEAVMMVDGFKHVDYGLATI
jgi:hypothetical protein